METLHVSRPSRALNRLSRATARRGVPATPVVLSNSLLAAPDEHLTELPLSDDLTFFANAVGRFVTGGLYLIGGAPGSGKSLLSTQIGLDLARNGNRSLFVLTEQSGAAMKQRAVRMVSDVEPSDAARILGRVHVEQSVYDVMSLPAFVMREVLSPAGKYHGVKLIVLDSIQGEGLPAAATKSYGTVLEFGRLCTSNGITVLLVSHITKKGDIAGPKTLEHGVDVTLTMRRAMLYSLLSTRKNRFGPPLLRPTPLTIDRITTRLGVAPHAQARPGAARTYGGPMTGPMQVQASVAVPPDGRRGRTTAPGLPRREIEQLIDCIGQIDGFDLSNLDYRIQCRLPRSGQYLSYFGLPLCMSLIGSYARKALPENNLYLGEIDLFRKVLDVPMDVLRSLIAAIDAGEIATPITLFVPTSACEHLPRPSAAVRVVPCRTLEDAIFQTWPDLR